MNPESFNRFIERARRGRPGSEGGAPLGYATRMVALGLERLRPADPWLLFERVARWGVCATALLCLFAYLFSQPASTARPGNPFDVMVEGWEIEDIGF